MTNAKQYVQIKKTAWTEFDHRVHILRSNHANDAYEITFYRDHRLLVVTVLELGYINFHLCMQILKVFS